MMKFQITNTPGLPRCQARAGKSQINSNDQNSNVRNRFGHLVIGIWILFVIWCLEFGIFSSICSASNEAALVREGNQLYNDGKIDEALKNYNQALTAAPDEPLINFNIANSLYKKAQYDEAIKTYEKALISSDKKIEAQANYNIGNSKFRQGRLKESSDLAGAIVEYRQSLDYYKRAMELDPDDKDAKFNHEFVEKLIKKLLEEKASNQQQKQQQEGQGKKEEKKEQEGQQGKEGHREPSTENRAPRTEHPKGQDKQQEYQPGGDIAKEAKEPDKEMSREEARMLLNDYRQQEQQERQLGDKRAPMRYPDVDKDW